MNLEKIAIPALIFIILDVMVGFIYLGTTINTGSSNVNNLSDATKILLILTWGGGGGLLLSSAQTSSIIVTIISIVYTLVVWLSKIIVAVWIYRIIFPTTG